MNDATLTILVSFIMGVILSVQYKYDGNNDKYKSIPVVIVSTESSKDDKEKGMALGAVAYLTKPFKLEELQGIVRKALSL